MTEKATSNTVEDVTIDANLEKGNITLPSIHSNRLDDAAKLNLDTYNCDDSDGKILLDDYSPTCCFLTMSSLRG